MQQYRDLLNAILEKGTYKPAARENMPGTKSLFGYQFRHNLQDGFPLLTTKKMFWKGIVVELLWFLRGDTNIKYLIDNGVNIWNEDAYNYYCKRLSYFNIGKAEPFLKLSFEEFIGHIAKGEKYEIEDYKIGDCGYQYGKVWRAWEGEAYAVNFDFETVHTKTDQIANVIKSIKENPTGRRHIVTAWDPGRDHKVALQWCHAIFQFNCRPMDYEDRNTWFLDHVEPKENVTLVDEITFDKYNVPKYYLDCQLYQRSADVFLGVPFNIASYALLTHIIAKICNMVPGEFVHTFGDVHIYDNHMDAVKEQLTRAPFELPKILLPPSANYGSGIDDFLMSVELYKDEFRLVNYQSYPAIKAELSTGMKK